MITNETNGVILSPEANGDNVPMQMMPIGRLVLRKTGQVRKKRDPEKQARMNKSVKLHGILQPLLVMETSNVIEILAGEGRYIAALAAGLEEVPVRFWHGSLANHPIAALQIVENDVHSGLQDSERFLGVMEIRSDHPELTGKEIAHLLSEDPAVISKMFTVNDRAMPAVKEAFLADVFGLSIAYPIALETEAVQHQMLAAYFSGNATREDLKAMSRKARSTSGPVDRVSRIKCVMDGGVVQVSGKDIDLEAACGIVQAWLKRAKKAIEAGWNAKTLEQACKAEAGA